MKVQFAKRIASNPDYQILARRSRDRRINPREEPEKERVRCTSERNFVFCTVLKPGPRLSV